MESNAQHIGQKLKSEEYQCSTCGESKAFNPWDDKGRIQPCPECMAKQLTMWQSVKNITSMQWGWIFTQAFLTLAVVFSTSWNLKTGIWLAIGGNLAVLILIGAAQAVWFENK